MEVKQSSVFNFFHPVDGVNYGFSIPAENEEEAIQKLLRALDLITSELTRLSKAATKAN